jgi:hypothetical protein
MKSLTKLLAAAAAVALCLTILAACESGDKTEPTTQSASMGAVSLCGGCGQIEGTDKCCAPGMKCSGCGLAKGSPGCCKMAKGDTDVALCTGCGHIKGSEMCCKQYQAKCAGCGLVKGSAGCCKIPSDTGDK